MFAMFNLKWLNNYIILIFTKNFNYSSHKRYVRIASLHEKIIIFLSAYIYCKTLSIVNILLKESLFGPSNRFDVLPKHVESKSLQEVSIYWMIQGATLLEVKYPDLLYTLHHLTNYFLKEVISTNTQSYV